MSTDWDKYSTPQRTKDNASRLKNKDGKAKKPDDYGIARFKVSDIRQVTSIPQHVEHDPLFTNWAHTNVENKDDRGLERGDREQLIIELKRITEWCTGFEITR